MAEEQTIAVRAPDPPPDLGLVALAPSDLPAAQAELTTWCEAKTHALRCELVDLRKNLKLAKEHKWRSSGLAAAVARTVKRVRFYEKMKAAVAAGYLIVPNFPVDIFAVRVKRYSPPAHTSGDERSTGTAKAELLPAGEGRYVDDRLFTRDDPYEQQGSDGKMRTYHRYTATEYDAVEFPVTAVKPVILQATERAMALRIFDRIGVVTGRRADPIVVGQLLDPRSGGWNERVVTFFIAWWLDTRTL